MDRQRPTKLYQLKTGDETNLKESGYDKTLPTKIFAHGFEMNGYDNEEVLKVRDGKQSPSYFIYNCRDELLTFI